MALKEHTRKDLESKFRNIYALIKKNRLISDIAWLNQLDRGKGLDHSKTYDIYDCSDVFYGIYFPQRGKNSFAILNSFHLHRQTYLQNWLFWVHQYTQIPGHSF
jgi:hypothetical protein